MKINRQLAILMHVLTHGQSTAQALAVRFEVSARTIRRDMEDLSQAGIPIYATQGAGGGIRLMDGYSLSRVIFDDSEKALLLSTLSNLSRSQDIGADQVLDKLGALFGPSGQEEWLRVDLASWGLAPKDFRFASLRDAIRSRRLVHFSYTRQDGVLDNRTVEPMTLLYRGTSWYLWGWCQLRSDFRFFRLSRMRAIQILEDTFIRRTGTLEEVETSYNSGHLVDLMLRFDATAAQRVWDFFDSDCINMLPNGQFEINITWPMNDWVISTLLSYGPELEVLSPIELRQTLREKAMQIADRYQKE
ncbi:MAG: YafY family transcriptional regulator [Gorillibacterium sp.]|nr:YafY family transcriptional regulator [Gorillibacterium sp.]